MGSNYLSLPLIPASGTLWQIPMRRQTPTSNMYPSNFNDTWWPSDSLQWRHNEHDGVPIHQPHGCLLNRSFRRRSKKTSKLRVTGLCAGKSPVTGEFPAQKASNAENVFIWWRHHVISKSPICEMYSDEFRNSPDSVVIGKFLKGIALWNNNHGCHKKTDAATVFDASIKIFW